MFDNIEPPSDSRGGQLMDSWNGMNMIQRTGVGGGILLFFFSIFIDSTKTQVIVQVCACSSGVLGLMASALWKARHALRFWPSMIAACVLHVFLLPIYIWLISMLMRPIGKLIGVLALLLITAERFFFVWLIKRIALRSFKKRLKSAHLDREAFSGKSL